MCVSCRGRRAEGQGLLGGGGFGQEGKVGEGGGRERLEGLVPPGSWWESRFPELGHKCALIS